MFLSKEFLKIKNALGQKILVKLLFFVQMLSRCTPAAVQMLSRSGPDGVKMRSRCSQVRSRFGPDGVKMWSRCSQVRSRFGPDAVQMRLMRLRYWPDAAQMEPRCCRPNGIIIRSRFCPNVAQFLD